MIKVAVVTDDGKSISQHFGRARYYRVFTIGDGKITGQELREKAGHHDFAGHEHEEHHEHGSGHGMGTGAARRHASMIAAITDCEALIVCGTGQGACIARKEANIRPIVTDIMDIEAAVQAYIDGTLVDHPEKLH